jgi:hypothetical protein
LSANANRYGPIGQCIYCGSKDDLSDEHIVPYGLNGNLILEKASCPACARNTSETELRVLRGFMHRARTVGRFRTRRPKERPDKIPFVFMTGRRKKCIDLAVASATAFLQLPVLKRAAYLEPRPYTAGAGMCGLEVIPFGKDPAELATGHAADGFEDSANLDCVSFARMIAKIGYAFAVAINGIDAIEEPLVLGAIRGIKDDVGMWVGSHDFVMKSESLGAVHALATGIVPVPVGGRTENLVMSWVKLFAGAHTTAYEVVVGRPAGHTAQATESGT